MKIIAFSGKKQSGKTTAVNYLASQCVSVDIIGFFSFAKEIIRRCFNVVGNQDLQETKDQMLDCGSTVRELQQRLGTDIFRGIDKCCWVNAYKSLVEDSWQSDWPPKLTLTADVRFPNEVKCIQDLGGHVIRLLRNPFNDQHESETALDNMEQLSRSPEESAYYTDAIKFDAIIDNREMTIEEQNTAVWKLVTERGWI